MKRLIDTSTAEKIIFEIPLLFEGGLEKCFDLVINVYVDHETQISRLISRNNFTRIEAENRINSQLATKTKMDLADLNVDNNGSLIQLRMQLDRLVVNLDSFSPKEVESIS